MAGDGNSIDGSLEEQSPVESPPNVQSLPGIEPIKYVNTSIGRLTEEQYRGPYQDALFAATRELSPDTAIPSRSSRIRKKIAAILAAQGIRPMRGKSTDKPS